MHLPIVLFVIQIRVSLEEIVIKKDETAFWTSLGNALRANYEEVKPIGTKRDFLDAFLKNTWKEQKIVIFLDEFDKLFDASNEVRSKCLETFRAIKTNSHLYAIHSIVACGTFSIRHLNSTGQRFSPFNVAEFLRNPYFTLEQTQRLFNEYAQNEKITIDNDIVDDIFSKSNGYVLQLNWYCIESNLPNIYSLFDRHPGMICLCGRAIAEDLRAKIDHRNNLAYEVWQDYSISQQNNTIGYYRTFRRMVELLLSEPATDAINLLRTYFVGFLGEVSWNNESRLTS